MYRYILLCVMLVANNAMAQLKLPNILGSNMVLQRDARVPIWGWTKAGSKVTVKFGTQNKTAVADTGGRWQVNLDALPANRQPQILAISSDTSTCTFTNILVGEVWLCSGQSNMEYPVKKFANYTNPARGADSAALELGTHNPQIRLITIEKKLSLPDATTSGWNESEGVALEKASAMGYFFAKHIQRTLNVPVGIISSSWGGSRIEPWTPASGYTDLPAFATEAAQQPLKIEDVEPGKNYRSMILPLSPFAIRGVLWYQGESNAMLHEPGMRYADKMQALVQSWRKQFNNSKMPFYSVLIAPHYYTHRKDKLQHTTETLPLFWEQQVASTAIPNTGLITVTDLVDDLANIHPSYKWEVGRRMALLALAKTYNYKATIYSGPVFEKMKIKNGKAILSFANADGLRTDDQQAPTFFSIAGADGNFVDAEARIVGNTIEVSSPSVPKPANVHFAWTEVARPNLVNGAGLPAVPFRSNGVKWDFKK